MAAQQFIQLLMSGKGWWLERSARERVILMAGAAVVAMSGCVTLGSHLWHFYHTLPQQKAELMQRQWLIDDVQELRRADKSKVISPAIPFLTRVAQVGSNGQCKAQSETTWLCTGQSASLEAVQQWWLSGRREGYYVERFEAKQQTPGRVQWTLLVKR